MSDDNKCPRCGNKMKNGVCPFCPRKGALKTKAKREVFMAVEITDEAIAEMIEEYYASKDCACGHPVTAHWHQLGNCNQCSCKKVH